MADHDRDAEPIEHPPDHLEGAQGRGRVRPLLAVAALIPLAAALGVLALTPASEVGEATRAESVSRPGPVQSWCPGPLQPPDPLLEEGPDADLSVTAPSEVVDVGSVALEPESSLLFGTVSGAETLQEEDGSIRSPRIDVETGDGALDGEAAAQDLGVGVRADTGLTEGPRVEAATSQGIRPVADAVQSTATGSGDFRSLSATRCARPATEASFLGISTTSGSSAALVLRNPGTRPATASVQVWTEDGPASMDGRSQVVVAPGQEQRVLLESVAAGHQTLGLGVSVLGSPLAMHVQSTEREGLTPGGGEMLTSLPPAAPRQVMPAVHVAGSAPTLVLATPDGGPALARVEVLGSDGPVEDAALEDVEIPGHGVSRIPLDGLADGDYTVTVESEEDVLATTRSTVTGTDLPGDTVGAPVDFTLAEAAPVLAGGSAIALPAGGAHGYLELGTVADTAVSIIPVAADGSAGDPVERELRAGTSTTVLGSTLAVDGDPPSALTVVPAESGALHAAWMQRQTDDAGDVMISALPVPPSRSATDAVTVRLGE